MSPLVNSYQPPLVSLVPRPARRGSGDIRMSPDPLSRRWGLGTRLSLVGKEAREADGSPREVEEAERGRWKPRVRWKKPRKADGSPE